MTELKRLLRVPIEWLVVTCGGLAHVFGWKTPNLAYLALIRLFCRTGGKSNDLLSRGIAKVYRPYAMGSPRGVLGEFDRDELRSVIGDLDERGFHVFARRLPSDLCDRLLTFALTQPCVLRPMSTSADAREPRLVDRYDREHPQGVRYDFRAQDVIDNLDVQQLMTDKSLIGVAQGYLRCKPIFDVTTMWWHTAYSKQPDKDAAQFWHFDMDRIKWLKFFIYLTDVSPESGPHCFVAGSQRTGGIPRQLRDKGYARLTDEEVAACYAPERFIEFTAPRGTVLAEDTRGLHKGKHVASGDRLVLQLQFSNSLFGGAYEKVRFTRYGNAELSAMVQHYPRLYSNYAA